MKVNITNLYGMERHNVTQIAQNETAQIAKQLGANELSIFRYDVSSDSPTELSKRLDGINASLQVGDIVIFQYLTWNGYDFEEAYLQRLRVYHAKIAIFVHDVIGLRFASEGDIKRSVAIFNLADLLILPSKAMEDALRAYGLTVKKVVYQTIFDRLLKEEPPVATFAREMTFAGSQRRFPFSKNWNYPTRLRLFSKVDNPDRSLNIEYMGFHEEAEMIRLLNRGFGLCWSEDIPGCPERRYSQLNASFKLSTYLAAGLPLVANDDISVAPLIKKYGLGFLAPDLATASEMVQKCTPQEYAQMADRVHRYSFLLRQGWNFRRVYTETVDKLLTD